MREVNPQPVRGLILQDLNEHETTLTYSSLVFSTRAINKEVHIGNVSHNKLITNITAFSVPLVSVMVKKVGVATQHNPELSNSHANTDWGKYSMLSEKSFSARTALLSARLAVTLAPYVRALCYPLC